MADEKTKTANTTQIDEFNEINLFFIIQQQIFQDKSNLILSFLESVISVSKTKQIVQNRFRTTQNEFNIITNMIDTSSKKSKRLKLKIKKSEKKKKI